jgi:hypothetical protein
MARGLSNGRAGGDDRGFSCFRNQRTKASAGRLSPYLISVEEGFELGHLERWFGEEEGIRTPDRLAPAPHFECGAFNYFVP